MDRLRTEWLPGVWHSGGLKSDGVGGRDMKDTQYLIFGHMRLDYMCEEEYYKSCRLDLHYYPGDLV